MAMCILLIGCGFMANPHMYPTAEQIATADFGTYPYNYKDMVNAYMAYIVLDPSSVQYRDWTTPKKNHWGHFASTYYGYTLCVSINAKNAMGGYVGFDTYDFFIRDGKVRDHTDYVSRCNRILGE
jgi:hypothetical protein